MLCVAYSILCIGYRVLCIGCFVLCDLNRVLCSIRCALCILRCVLRAVWIMCVLVINVPFWGHLGVRAAALGPVR